MCIPKEDYILPIKERGPKSKLGRKRHIIVNTIKIVQARFDYILTGYCIDYTMKAQVAKA